MYLIMEFVLRPPAANDGAAEDGHRKRATREVCYIYVYIYTYTHIYGEWEPHSGRPDCLTASRRRRRRQGWSQGACYAGGMIHTCIYQ